MRVSILKKIIFFQYPLKGLWRNVFDVRRLQIMVWRKLGNKQ